MKIYLIVSCFNKDKISDPLIRLLAITSPAIITEEQVEEQIKKLSDKTGNKITKEEFFKILLSSEEIKTATLREITIDWNNLLSIKTLQKVSSI